MAALTQDLNGRVALITGATGGIGRATALALGNLGATIAIHYHANEQAALELSADLERLGTASQIIRADLSKYEDVRHLHKTVVETLGHPSILYNNHGIASPSGVKAVGDVSIEDFEHTWRANCGSSYLLAQLCIPAMEESGWGRVIFCSSVAGFTGGLVGPHYASSKSALHGLVHWLSGAYSKKGITVNAIAPALIEDTAMLPGGKSELAQRIPVGRLGKPAEIAETVVWMVKTGYVNNKVIAVDGGTYAY